MSVIYLTTKKRGFSLVEMILYVSLLTFVTGIIVSMLISVGGIYKNIKLSRELESSGTIAMEIMLREIRNASSVLIGESVLGSNPGSLVISGVGEDLIAYQIKFDLNSGVLRISKNGEVPIAMTSSPIVVSYLLFTRLTNANSEGVRIELEVSGIAGSVSKTERFFGFAVLRGSY